MMRGCNLLYLTIILLFFLPPTSSFSEIRPDSLDGVSLSYPEDKYLTGIGHGSSRKVAEDEAYAAISKIFSARITSISKDYERYSHNKTDRKKEISEEMSVEQSTEVTTDKVLENITIAETWYDSSEKVYYALAVIDRAKAGNSLRGKITSLDLEIHEMVKRGESTTDKIQKIRNLKGAVKRLIQREAYNADLRIINLSGEGIDSPVSLVDISNGLHNFLKNNFAIGVEITGKRGDEVKTAIIEGLNKEGFSVVNAGQSKDMLVEGEVEFKEVNVQNPRFKFIRWTANFKLIDKNTNRVIGSITESDREGHLTIKEAEDKALKALQDEIVKEISKKLSEFVYGAI